MRSVEARRSGSPRRPAHGVPRAPGSAEQRPTPRPGRAIEVATDYQQAALVLTVTNRLPVAAIGSGGRAVRSAGRDLDARDGHGASVSGAAPGTSSGAAPGTQAAPGHGLIGMTERASLVGGALSAGPVPGGGWRVRLTVPGLQTSRTDERSGRPRPGHHPHAATGLSTATARAVSPPSPSARRRPRTSRVPPSGRRPHDPSGAGRRPGRRPRRLHRDPRERGLRGRG
ncbi:hypothetical protein NKG05_09390 [Oerskovia sp. M15]